MTATKTEQARVLLQSFTSERTNIVVDESVKPHRIYPHFRVKAAGVMVLPNGDEIPVETTLTDAEMEHLGEVAGRIGQRYMRELALALGLVALE